MACMIGSPSTDAKSSFTALREFMVVEASVGQLLSSINYAAVIVGKVGAFSGVGCRLSMVCGLARFYSQKNCEVVGPVVAAGGSCGFSGSTAASGCGWYGVLVGRGALDCVAVRLGFVLAYLTLLGCTTQLEEGLLVECSAPASYCLRSNFDEGAPLSFLLSLSSRDFGW